MALNSFTPNAIIQSSEVNENFSGLADGTEIQSGAITAAKLDASAIAHGYIEIGRTTLSVAGDTITVSSIPVRKYLMVLISTVDSGGTTNQAVRFNNDSGNNYSQRYSVNGAADITGTSASSFVAQPSTNAADKFAILYINNVATTEKLVIASSIGASSVGAASPPDRIEITAKWANTTDSITRIDVINTGTGDFAIGSEVVVLGKN